MLKNMTPDNSRKAIHYTNKVKQVFLEFDFGEKNSEFIDKSIILLSDSDSNPSDSNCESSENKYLFIDCSFTVYFTVLYFKVNSLV